MSRVCSRGRSRDGVGRSRSRSSSRTSSGGGWTSAQTAFHPVSTLTDTPTSSLSSLSSWQNQARKTSQLPSPLRRRYGSISLPTMSRSWKRSRTRRPANTSRRRSGLRLNYALSMCHLSFAISCLRNSQLRATPFSGSYKVYVKRRSAVQQATNTDIPALHGPPIVERPRH